MGDTQHLVAQQLRDAINLKSALLDQVELLAECSELILSCYRKGCKLLFAGNGGSAADSQHLAAELVGRYGRERPGLPAIALTVNTSTLTAIGNDYGYDRIFARQIEAIGTHGDVFVAISTSGNSINILRGVAAAKDKGISTIGLTGEDGGKLAEQVDFCVRVPTKDTARIQEAHITIGHIWCGLVEDELFGAAPKARPVGA